MTWAIANFRPKSAKGSQKKCQRVPKSAKREAKGSQREGRAKSLFYLASTLKKVTCKIKHLRQKSATESHKRCQRVPSNAKRETIFFAWRPHSKKSLEHEEFLEIWVGTGMWTVIQIISIFMLQRARPTVPIVF